MSSQSAPRSPRSSTDSITSRPSSTSSSRSPKRRLQTDSLKHSRSSSSSSHSSSETQQLYVCDYDFVESSLQPLPQGGLEGIPFDGTKLEASSSVFQTRYTLSGNSDGHLCVLIHGLGGFSYMFEPLEKSLKEAGVQVLRYDLAGRGYTPHKKSYRYDVDMYVEQLDELLRCLQLKERKYAVVGLSMGATIASAMAVRDANVVASCLLAPTGNMTPPIGACAFAFTQRIFSWTLPLVASTMFTPSSTSYIKGDFVTVDDNDGDTTMPTECLENGKSLRSWALGWNSASLEENSGRPLATSVAKMPITTLIRSYIKTKPAAELKTLQDRALAVKLFCGRHDKTINDPGLEAYETLFGKDNVQCETFPGRHCFWIQCHQLVNPKVVVFLQTAFAKDH
eukprot:m.18185 g.18185  ORF g.18185 m.18185 type:complete len:395 (-) comp11871_c0_seq1:41-1225(-)